MANGEDVLAGTRFGFRNERFFLREKNPNGVTWLPCIHWQIDGRLAGRLVALQGGGFYLTLHEICSVDTYEKDPRAEFAGGELLFEQDMPELDPLLIVSMVEEWKKLQLIKVVEHPEAAMLSSPS